MEGKEKAIPIGIVETFMRRCFKEAGASEENARQMAESLAAADYRGHFSHGLNRLRKYVNDLQNGVVGGKNHPTVTKETLATALVDGNNSPGAVVGNFCMNIAVQKAKKFGVGWVVAKHSNHFGIAGYYAMQAQRQNLVGFTFTNSRPTVKTNRSNEYTLGTNPISCAAPAQNEDSFVLDMSTSTVARGKLELYKRKQIPIPHSWGVDSEGKESNDPTAVLNGGGLLPLGGVEETGGYKGFGLAMMVEIMTGIMSGSAYSKNIKMWDGSNTEANLGQCFVAVNPDAFCDGFDKRLQDLLNSHRQLSPTEPDKKILVAGDLERQHMVKCDKTGAIEYPSQVIDSANTLAEELGISELHRLTARRVITNPPDLQ